MSNLNNLLEILLENELDFVLIGGFASVVHGSSMVTRDIDICALCTPENITKLREVLKDFNPVHRQTPQRLSFIEIPKSLDGINNLYIDCELGVLDIHSSVTSVGNFQRVKEKAIEITLFGHKCKVISIDDLIATKKAMGRSKDLMVIAELEKIKEQK
ncbi:MAG: nucleotidyltransferase [Pseudomonadota bacterium]